MVLLLRVTGPQYYRKGAWWQQCHVNNFPNDSWADVTFPHPCQEPEPDLMFNSLGIGFWTTFLPVCGTQATGLWRHLLSPSVWALGTQSMDPIAYTQLTLLLPLLHSLEQSGNWNCWLKINPLVLAKAQTSKVLPFDFREWMHSVLCQTEP